MMQIKRGDIYFVDIEYNQPHIQRGRRMYLVVSNNSGNKWSNIVIVVPLTTKKKAWLPTHTTVYITLHNNKKVKNTVLCEQIQTVPKCKLTNFICHLNAKQMKPIDGRLKASLHLS